MVLCDTAPKIGSDELWNGRIEAVENGDIKSLADGILERWFSKEFPKDHPATYAGYKAMLSRQSDAGYTASSAAIRDADFTDDCANIKIPTLRVVGDQDGATPPSVVAELAKLIPDSRFEVIKDTGLGRGGGVGELYIGHYTVLIIVAPAQLSSFEGGTASYWARFRPIPAIRKALKNSVGFPITDIQAKVAARSNWLILIALLIHAMI